MENLSIGADVISIVVVAVGIAIWFNRAMQNGASLLREIMKEQTVARQQNDERFQTVMKTMREHHEDDREAWRAFLTAWTTSLGGEKGQP